LSSTGGACAVRLADRAATIPNAINARIHQPPWAVDRPAEQHELRKYTEEGGQSVIA
jgi:hypothetical protein